MLNSENPRVGGSIDSNRLGVDSHPSGGFAVLIRWIPRFARHPFGAPLVSKPAMPICRESVRRTSRKSESSVGTVFLLSGPPISQSPKCFLDTVS